MGRSSGVALRGLQFFARSIEFCCAAIVLALFSYFLGTLSNHNMSIATWVRAVEGISGAGVLYTIIAFLLLCCVPGHPFPSFIMMVLDVAFAAAFIYVAVANRAGASSCSGQVDTVFGKGNADTNVVDNGNGGFMALPSLRQACKMETACMSVSIISIFFFIISALLSFALVRHHRKERRFGPSPANDYTEGYGGRKPWYFFGFGRKHKGSTETGADPNALPEHTTPDMMRDSYATEQTRVDNNGGYGGLGNGTSKYETPYGNPGDAVPMTSYPASNAGYRYEDNGGVYR